MDQAARDAEALAKRRERLRALACRIAESVEALPPPETWLEATRSARSITLADRILTRFPDQEGEVTARPIRQRLRVAADRLMDTAENLPLPDTHLEGERACRFTLAAGRMIEQLYAPPVPPKPVKAAPPPTPEPKLPRGFASWDTHAAWKAIQPESRAERIAAATYDRDRRLRFEARRRGRWTDGTPWTPEQPNHRCQYIHAKVEGFDPEAALHPHEKATPGKSKPSKDHGQDMDREGYNVGVHRLPRLLSDYP